jgi:hypothetical protein
MLISIGVVGLTLGMMTHSLSKHQKKNLQIKSCNELRAKAHRTHKGQKEKQADAAAVPEAVPPEQRKQKKKKKITPQSINGVWVSIGRMADGIDEEELVFLEATADGVVAGMIDSDNDGSWTKEDCKVEGKGNAIFAPPCYTENDQFTKAGSGETQEKLKTIRGVFFSFFLRREV